FDSQLSSLRLLPQLLHLPPRHFRQSSPLLSRHLLHLPKSPVEFPAGLLHRNFRIDLQKPRQVHRRKQNIPHFSFNLLASAFLQHLPQFFRLFLQLLENPPNVLPVKPDPGRLSRQLVPFQQRRQASRHTIEHALRRLFFHCTLRLPLFFLNDLPVPQHLRSVLRLLLPKHVRVPTDHLFVNLPDHINNREPSLFIRHLRVKHHLQEQITQLLKPRPSHFPSRALIPFLWCSLHGFLQRTAHPRPVLWFMRRTRTFAFSGSHSPFPSLSSSSRTTLRSPATL